MAVMSDLRGKPRAMICRTEEKSVLGVRFCDHHLARRWAGMHWDEVQWHSKVTTGSENTIRRARLTIKKDFQHLNHGVFPDLSCIGDNS